MFKKISYQIMGAVLITLVVSSCKTPSLMQREVNKTTPEQFADSKDSTNSADIKWNEFFADPHLNALIDTALKNNQELNITLQEIEIARNEVRARKGEYLPFVGLGASAGAEKPGRFTRNGAVEANVPLESGRAFPEPLPDFMIGATATWEIDIWNKLRNSRKAAYNRYIGSTEARNFLVTNLISEIANSYFELLALDNQLKIIQQNIETQKNALKIVRLEKQSARVTELAVKRFEAQVLNTQSLQYDIQQQIVETENRINFLVGRYPQRIERDSDAFSALVPKSISEGIPSQLLENRPDVRQAERELEATKLEVKAARANFYPSLGISADVGLQAFNPTFLLSPESIAFSLAGDLMAPLLNRNAIKAAYYSANATQLQAVYNYEQTLLRAYIEVANELAHINNLEQSYQLRSQQVDALTQSVSISNNLFRSARADYMEVLLTQRDALESRFDLVETKMKQMNAMVNVYRALGGGWK
ncbi:MAG: efflux transporter outer membrane subunit [Cyclobacteriaceae bacterium]